MNPSLIIPAGYFSAIKKYLFDGTGNEYSCYLLCGIASHRSRQKILGRSLLLPDKGIDYRNNSGVSCQPTLQFINEVLFDAPRENDLIQKNLSIVDFHSHPFAKGEGVSFSSLDDEWQRECVDYFFEARKYEGFYCAAVLSEQGFDGRVWYKDKQKGGYRYDPLREIIVLDYPFRKWQNPQIKRRVSLSRMQRALLDRQIRAFGEDGQKVMSSLCAGIVGVGGIGAIAAEGLARMGISRFVLVDHDRAELSNLNRFPGMTYADAVAGTPKTTILHREILKINPNAVVQPVRHKVETIKARELLKMVDFVVLGTDNLLSRAFVNEFCLQYCIPLFSVGSIINADETSGNVEDIFAEYRAVIPGDSHACLGCVGGIDYHEVGYLRSSPEVREEGENRGYVNLPGFHQPAVLPLNGAITQMALSEIHNYFCGFKGELIEGFLYDQKKNSIMERRFLNERIHQWVDGAFLECSVEDGMVKWLINGEGPYRMGSLQDMNSLPDRIVLTEKQRAFVENFIQTSAENAQKKSRCTLCGKSGITGRGDNEPLPDDNEE